MAMTYEERLAQLNEHIHPLQPEDTMPEAGRKIVLVNYIDWLEHEAKLNDNDSMHHVHQMRVAIRRIRSAFRVLGGYYNPKIIREFRQNLKHTATLLGTVRDTDVMLEQLKVYQKTLADDHAAIFQGIVAQMEQRRVQHHKKLLKWLTGRDYRQFSRKFTAFLIEQGKSSRKPLTQFEPFQVRHIAPVIFHEHLAHVKAFDTLLPTEDITLLHALRIEFKRLRYTLTFFKEVLGASIEDFIDEVKSLQEYLGTLNDGVVAREQLASLALASAEEAAALQTYLEFLHTQVNSKVADFPELWAKFNTRAIQRKLSDALLVMR